MFTAFLADYFTVVAVIAVAADVSAIGADLAAIGADPYMILALAAVATDIFAVIAGAFTFGTELCTCLAELALRTVIGGAFKALETIHTVGAFTSFCQTFAAVGTMTSVVSCTVVT